MTFDPTNFNPDDYAEEPGQELVILPEGNYILTSVGFNRKEKNGKTSISFCIKPIFSANGEVINADRYFAVWLNCYLTEKAFKVLANYCKACGVSKPFNVEDDNHVSELLRWIPFKASIKHRTFNGRTNAEVGFYYELGAGEREMAEEAIQEMIANAATGADSGGSSGGSGSSSGGSYGGSDWDDPTQNNQGDFSDDDIPF
jgi:uncharacterized membrane protein YgcG